MKNPTSLPVASLGPTAKLCGVPRLMPFQDLENKLNTNDMEAREISPPTLTKDFSFQKRRSGSTASVGDLVWRNKEEGCRRGGTSGAQDESLTRNTMREGVEEQEPRGEWEEKPSGYLKELTGRGAKENGRSNTGAIVESNPSGSGDENKHNKEETWLKDWWCPPLPLPHQHPP
ncbi:hypothetical protein NDU88_003595 [Pleurodeles waltl]|uniref:Uncharacterized protein n=1 Tax=Pleurodeles waltl TaxID=8319 RepID=A0AAV7QC69_PLEWA|nr:hypothetical protein NDU88_003595 [Pleurodeles waltl]